LIEVLSNSNNDILQIIDESDCTVWVLLIDPPRNQFV